MTDREIFADFRRLAGEARRVAQMEVQQALFNLGYYWRGKVKEPKHTNSAFLCLNSQRWDSRAISCIADHEAPPPRGGLVFDVSTKAAELLELAQQVVEQSNHG